MQYGSVHRKINAAGIFNCEDLTDFISSIVRVLPYKGISQSRFYLCEYEGVRFLTKLCFYRKTPPEIYGKVTKKVIPQTDAEINILKIFKERLINKNITPCILELVYDKICSNVYQIAPDEKVCERLMLKDDYFHDDVEKTMCKYSDLVRNKLAHNKCAFLVLERCDMTLDEYLKKSINTPVSLTVFKSLLFMIVYTMFAIRRVFPSFQHYDLHTDNVMLKFDSNYKFTATNPKFLIFNIDGETYSVPYFGIVPKIIDFGFSALPEENIISNVTVDKVQMYYRSNNDLLFLFYHIHETLSATGGDKLGRVDKLLNALEPNRAYVQYYIEYIRKVEQKIPSYEKMIKNKIWNEYKKITVPRTQIYNEFSPI